METPQRLLTVRVPGDLLARIEEAARERGYYPSEFVRILLRRALRYAEDIPPKPTEYAARTRSA